MKRKLSVAAVLLTALLLIVGCTEQPTDVSSVPEEGSSWESISSEPSAPEPSVPEARETELELVASFKTGEGGLFQYQYIWPESGVGDPIFNVPSVECADDKGNIYIVHTDDFCVYRVNDGAKFAFAADSSVWNALVLGDRMYLRTVDGAVHTLDLTNGERHLYTPHISEESIYSYFFVTPDGKEPLLYSSEQHLYLDLYGNRAFSDVLSAEGALVCGDRTVELQIDDVEAQAYRVGSGGIVVDATKRLGSKEERILRIYGETGVLRSQCKLTVKERDAYTVTLGSDTFEVNLLPTLFPGSDGTLYLLLYYPDHGEVYRVLPGNVDVTFSEEEESYPLPEERETELELVTSFKTGEGGLFPYFFYWAESGPEHAAYKTTRAECADEKGNVYVVLIATGYCGDICRLNDGKMYVRGANDLPLSMLYSKGLLYLQLEDSYVETIDVESGERTTIVPSAYLEEHTGDFRFVSSNGEEPIWLRYDGEERYSLDGKALPAKGYPRTVVRTDESTGDGILTGGDVNRILSLDGDTVGGEWSVKYEDARKILCVASRFKRYDSDEPYFSVWEEIYCLYGQNGNIISKFKHTMIGYNEQPCSFPFTQFGDAYVLEAYNPLKVTVDDYTFENVFDYKKIYGSNGTMYLLLYYFDHGEVYRILPGYENATFSKLTEAEAN